MSHRPTPTAPRRPFGISCPHPPTTFRCCLPSLLIVKCPPQMLPTIVVPRRPHLWTRSTLLRGDSSLPSPSSVIIVLPSAPPPMLPSVASSRTIPPLLIVIFPSIPTPSSHLNPPLFCQYTPRSSPHIVRVTQILIKHCVGWCIVLTNPMDCAQTKHMRHHPWCVDDAYALGWGALTPHAMVWAKAAQHHGCGDSVKIISALGAFLNLV